MVDINELVRVNEVQAPWVGGTSDRAAQLATAIDVAVSQGKSLELPAGLTRISAGLMKNIAPGFSIRGQGPHLTTLRIDNVVSDQLLWIGRSAEVGGLSEIWPSYSSFTNTENPSTKLSADAKVGDFVISLDDASTIAPGDLIKVKTQRLWEGEDRNRTFWGELNRAISKSGNDVSLEAPITGGYKVGVLYSGTASGGTAYSIDLTAINTATPIDADQIVGCRLKITGGTGAGQTRYISAYDTTTKIAQIDSVSQPFKRNSASYSQPDFSPVPDATSVVQIDAQPFVFVIKPMAGFAMTDLTLDCSSAPSVTTGLWLNGIVEPRVENVKIAGASKTGIRYTQCWRPVTERPILRDLNDETLGYGVLFDESRTAEVYEINAYNCRRAIDCAGSVPTHVGMFLGGTVIGGQKDSSGTPWSPTNQNYGIGSHGQSCDWLFKGITVDGVMVGAVQRGVRETYDSIEMVGPMQRDYWALRGRDMTIINPIYSSRGMNRNKPALPAPPASEGHFLAFTSQFNGYIDIIGGRLDGLQGSLVYGDLEAARAVGARCNVKVRVNGTIVDWETASTAYVVNASTTFVAREWDLRPIARSIRGGGSIVPWLNLLRSAGTAGENLSMRVSEACYAISVTDDTVLRIPLPLGSDTQVGFRIRQVNNALTVLWDGVIRVGSATSSAYSTPLGSITVSALATVPTGTSGTDGRLNLHHDGSALYIENRTGSQLDAVIAVDQRI